MTLHVIGAGMAGLAAAVYAAARGISVVVYEAAGHAGGRCRSFYDVGLGTVIDNGTHLILGANHNVFAYLKTIGAGGALTPVPAAFPFFDLASGARWSVSPSRLRCLAGTGARWRDLSGLVRLWRASPTAMVTDCLDQTSTLYHRFWHPLTLAALNTEPVEAAASLLWKVTRDALLKGPGNARPYLAPEGLGAALVTPALAFLDDHGTTVRFGTQVRQLDRDSSGRVLALRAGGEEIPLGPKDHVVLALPPWSTIALLPGMVMPMQARAIVNVHYRLNPPPVLADRFLGLIGGSAHWLFVRDGILSITISAADSLAELPGEQIAAKLWGEAARVLGRAIEPIPPYRVIKERRATIAHTPQQLALRLGAGGAGIANLWLAGDWTATGMPCTIDGAISSGNAAAMLALRASRKPL